MFQKNTKVVCTLGPSSDSVNELLALIKAGMNVARLNFSHGTHEQHLKLIKNIHKAESLMNTRIGILQDLQGPKIRIGEMPPEGIQIKKDEVFTITIKDITGEKTKHKTIIPVTYKNVCRDVKKGATVLINDGLLESVVINKKKDELILKAKTSGVIKHGNGINFPNSTISAKTITEKDLKDLEFGLNNDVDFIALSFVKSKKDIEDLRALIQKKGKNTPIVAKIERHEAVSHLKEIIKATDGVMVARGDLGTDIPPEHVPLVQKRIIHLANKYGKPVITATQVLQSMVKNPIPTRAEISDAANAVFDHTDAIMLSNETAVGKYPARAALVLTKVAHSVEQEMEKHEELKEYNFSNKQKTRSSLIACENACDLTIRAKAAAIVAYTDDGFTPRQIAKYRISTPIITFTSSEKTARELTLVWGINKVFVKKFPLDVNKKLQNIVNFIARERLVKKGQKIVIICNASSTSTISTYKL
ncbi:MAG: pyruvate kinase [Candidatus Peregrinibacteria bacterium]|nr:pyruvate kinase [Candidatus Peregrinibacteria bacterium]